MKVIAKSISLANLPALTESEVGDRAKDWCEVLFTSVPEDRLYDAYTRAFADHASTFPLTAYEVKIAWERIAEEEANAAMEIARAESLERFNNAPSDCRRCDGSLFEIVCDESGGLLGRKQNCDHRPIKDGEGILIFFENEKRASQQRHQEWLNRESKQDALRICNQAESELITEEMDVGDDLKKRTEIIEARGRLRRVRRHIESIEGGL